jgi:hypothetical protein
MLWKFEIRSKPTYFRNLGWIRDPEVIISLYVYEYYEVLPLVAQVVALVLSQYQVLHDHEVGYISFIINACAGT